MSLHRCSKCFMNFLSSCTNYCFIKNKHKYIHKTGPLQDDHPQPEGNWVDNHLHLIGKNKHFELHVCLSL